MYIMRATLIYTPVLTSEKFGAFMTATFFSSPSMYMHISLLPHGFFETWYTIHMLC